MKKVSMLCLATLLTACTSAGNEKQTVCTMDEDVMRIEITFSSSDNKVQTMSSKSETKLGEGDVDEEIMAEVVKQLEAGADQIEGVDIQAEYADSTLTQIISYDFDQIDYDALLGEELLDMAPSIDEARDAEKIFAGLEDMGFDCQ